MTGPAVAGTPGPRNLEGLAWRLGDLLLVTVSLALVKLLGEVYAAIQLVFLRSVVGLLALTPWIAQGGWRHIRTRHPWLHLLRVGLTIIALTTSFHALTTLTLAEVITINHTRPLILTLLAWLVLRELVSRRRWTFTALGFVGLVVMVAPDLMAAGQSQTDADRLLALGLLTLGAACGTAAVVVQKILSRDEGEGVLMLVYSVALVIVAAVPAALVWIPPSLADWPVILAVGLTAIAGQFCFIRAHRLAEASYLAPVGYLHMVFGLAIGFLAFGEVPTASMLAGAAIIAACVLLGSRDRSP